MGDIKLFRYSGDESHELEPRLAQMEAGLQRLIERHMESILGIRLLAHEYRTGGAHRGSIDSLGIDENNCPVIVEYKRFNNENIICQGLFYLGWLLDHKAQFVLLLHQQLGSEAAARVEFAGSRVLCMASGFSRYDEQAVLQIDRNIELVRYRLFGEDMLMLEMLNTSLSRLSTGPDLPMRADDPDSIGMPASLQEKVRSMNPDIELLYLDLLTFAGNLGEDVSMRFLKHYIALARLKNFVCIQPLKGSLKLWLSLDPDHVPLEEGFSRDVRRVGHHGSGDLEVEIRNADTFAKAQPLIELAYQVN